MKKSAVYVVGMLLYSVFIAVSAFYFGKNLPASSTDITNDLAKVSAVEEEYYTAIETNGKLSLYKDGEYLMSLDTNVEMLPSIVRSQLKKGVEFKPSELPGIIEAFAE